MSLHLNSVLKAFQDVVFIVTEEGICCEYITPEGGEDGIIFDKNCVGKHFSEVVPSGFSQKTEQAQKDLKAGKERSQFDFHLEKNGDIRWYTVVLKTIEYKGKPHHLGVIRDFTARKNQELFIRGILDNSMSGIITFQAQRDSTGTIIDFAIKDINKTGLTLLGVSKKEALEMTLLKDITDRRRDEMLEKYLEVTTTGKTQEYTYQYTNLNARTFWFKSVVAKYRDGVVVTTQNITDQLQKETALRESEKKYRNIFDNVRDVFFRTDINGVVTDINPSIEKYSGYSREEVLGNNVVDFYYYTEDRQRLIQQLRVKKEVIDFEARMKTRAGTLAYTSINAHLVFDDDDKIEGIEGYMRDISQRKKAEDKLLVMNNQLKELNRQKDKLFSVIAHDLRNLVHGATGAAEYMADEFDSLSKNELIEFAELLKKNLHNTSNLLNDLLAWAGNQFREASTDFERIDFYELCEYVLSLLENSAKEKGVSLISKLPANFEVYGDQNMLKTILRNLLSNAIKYSGPGDNVTIDGRTTENGVEISVQDEGVGIPKKNLDKIFKASEYLTTKGTSGEKGSGLGLELCQMFAKKLNGTLRAESEEGVGSTFYITLPNQEVQEKNPAR